MSVYLISVRGGRKVALPVLTEESYRRLRNTSSQQANLRQARMGNQAAKRRLIQFNYSGYYPDGVVKGCRLPSQAFGFDVDDAGEFERIAKMLMEKRGPAMESQGTGAQRGSAGSASLSGSSSFSSFEATLCEYLGCWLEEVSFDVSREAHERVLRYRQLLEASGRPKLMEMAEKMDRALVKGGCIEVTRKRCEMWQQMMEDEGVKEDFDHLMAFSTSVPQVMLADTEMKVRQLPGRLYDFIADDAKFLSHLRYLMPPLCALRNILSYRLLRKLLCKKLGVSDAACRAAGNTDFSGSFSGCSSGSFSVSPSGSSVSSSSSSVSVSENGEEKGAGSSVYLSPVRGKKIDFIRVVNVLYELGLFTDKDGVRCTKKEAFRAFGRAVNLDLSNYNKDLSRALNDTTTRERQLQIFKDMRQKMAEIYQDKN